MIGAIFAKRRVHTAFDDLSRHRIDDFIENWDDYATFVHWGRRNNAEEIHGKYAIGDWFKKFAANYPLSSFAVRNVCVDNIFTLGGDNVVTVIWDVKLVNTSGEECDNSGLTLIITKNSKVLMVRDYLLATEQGK
jgi:hypothetical protein